ncbi:hypothetical protein [Sphingopyxis sp. 2PD]|uniref:hypothetical protein n=1 Tax=Sphingopyxis sp. 2PD TaxID=2502196 RepID=UPI0010F49A98|nr:hypothetical protein [Sphingopyxis sp. 2PD]
MAPVQDQPAVDHLKLEALALAAKSTKSFHAFARALSAAHKSDPAFLYEVEEAAKIKRRALFYLSDVGGFLTDHGITEKQAERIGWTKIQIVARHVRCNNAVSKRLIHRYLKIAEHTTAHRLPAALNNQDDDRPVTSRTVLLRIPADAYPALENALLAHGAEKQGRGLVGKEQAIMALIQSATPPARS